MIWWLSYLQKRKVLLALPQCRKALLQRINHSKDGSCPCPIVYPRNGANKRQQLANSDASLSDAGFLFNATFCYQCWWLLILHVLLFKFLICYLFRSSHTRYILRGGISGHLIPWDICCPLPCIWWTLLWRTASCQSCVRDGPRCSPLPLNSP